MAENKAQAEKEIRRLREEINRHDYLYYVKAQPEISDYEYDKLMKKLEELEKEWILRRNFLRFFHLILPPSG